MSRVGPGVAVRQLFRHQLDAVRPTSKAGCCCRAPAIIRGCILEKGEIGLRSIVEEAAHCMVLRNRFHLAALLCSNLGAAANPRAGLAPRICRTR